MAQLRGDLEHAAFVRGRIFRDWYDFFFPKMKAGLEIGSICYTIFFKYCATLYSQHSFNQPVQVQALSVLGILLTGSFQNKISDVRYFYTKRSAVSLCDAWLSTITWVDCRHIFVHHLHVSFHLT